MKKALIIDIDSTLANIDHRVHHVLRNCDCVPKGYVRTSNFCTQKCNSRKPKDWDSFFAEMKDDVPNLWCKQLIDLYSKNGYEVILVTGRPEKYKDITWDWLGKNRLAEFTTELYMRPDEEHDNDDEIKKKIYHDHIEGVYDVEFVIDDRPKVIRMWRSLGLTCLDCGDGIEF